MFEAKLQKQLTKQSHKHNHEHNHNHDETSHQNALISFIEKQDEISR